MLKGASMSSDLLMRVGAAYSMDARGTIHRAVAVEGDRVAAVSTDPRGLDDLISTRTRVLDNPQLTLLPAFFDNHNHLNEASLNSLFVQVGKARSVGELVSLIRERAASVPAGEWLQTSSDWNQDQLAEKRLPTAADLDQATIEHPVISRRGGHLAIVNSVALRMAGIDGQTPDPRGGHLGRGRDGEPDGILEGGAQYTLLHVPAPGVEDQIASLRSWCDRFATAGIGGVRDPIVSSDGMRLYQTALQRGALTIRVRPMLLLSPSGTAAEQVERLDSLSEWRDFGDDRLRTWGLKIVLDGGPETGALEEPYATDPSFSGQLNWEPDDLENVVHAAVQGGWRVGTHAIGDRTLRTLLDVYERVLADHPTVPPGTLVIEHAFLADRQQRARAVRLGVWITVQPALLHTLGAILLRLWGERRTAQIMPVRAWLNEGATLSAGTDYPIGSYSPIETIRLLATRETASIGVQGAEYVVDRPTAARLATVGTAQLLGESGRLGKIESGYYADMVAYEGDPLTCPLDWLNEMRPAFTLVGGQPVWPSDPLW
jgi:predicted amidohydrolase YtcJ